jgi:diguanylate cyclase (GGDEF)-like protein
MPLSNGMRLYVTAPESEIDRSWKSMIWEFLIAALIILAIASIVMLRFMGGITKPLRELAEAAKQADRGNYDFELNYSGDDEVGTLTHTFKLLSAHTKDKLSAAREKANIDALTGVKNKNAYEQRKAIIDTKIDNGEQEPFALVVCDINNLKAVNDLYGHREGDTCIKNACAKICGIFSHSPVFRIGGDEFVAILSGEDYFRRKKLMEQINAVPIDRSKIRNGETIAAGMSEYNEERHPSFTIMFEEADKAMYERKQFLKSMILPTESESDSESAYEYIPVIHARKQILIVDDMELTREMLGDLLQDDYDILYASDGVEAMDVLRSHKEDIDLVLLDLQMPNKSGREVIADMQIDEDLMSIPVMFLTVDQDAELDCLKSGAMDFIPKPFPDIEILKARIDKCIELSEDRDLIRYTERDKLTGVLNKDYFFRYVSRIDHLYKDVVLDAVVCDINHFSFLNKQYGRQFCDNVLRNIGTCLRKLARKTGGIVCRQDGDTFLLYCPHQDDYEKLIEDFLADLDSEKAVTDKVDLRFGVLVDAQQYPDPEERFVRAKIAADRVIDDKQKKCGYYDLKWKQ